MELRHLRYFVAAAEARSLKFAAEEKLHTTQPSLSRQIRDLENEIGTPLLLRGSRGVELTAAGRVFLDHARLMLAQADAAVHAARRIASPTRPSFSMGFMIGHDATWVPETLHLLRDELPNVHVIVSTQNSPQLAAALLQGSLDVAFLRRDDGPPGLDYLRLVEEPLELFLPRDHPLAARKSVRIREIVGETFLGVSGNALNAAEKPPALRLAIDRFLKDSGVDIAPSHEVDNLGAVMSLIASTGGVALLPTYARIFLSRSVVTRPLQGVTPRIDLSLGYRKANASPLLKLLLAKADELVGRVAKKRM